MIRLKAANGYKLLVFAFGFFLVRSFSLPALAMQTDSSTPLPVYNLSSSRKKELLVLEAEKVEAELSKSGPISVPQLSKDPRTSDDVVCPTPSQGLEGARSIGPQEIKGKEPFLDLSSPQGVNVVVEELAPAMVGLTGGRSSIGRMSNSQPGSPRGSNSTSFKKLNVRSRPTYASSPPPGRLSDQSSGQTPGGSGGGPGRNQFLGGSVVLVNRAQIQNR